MLAGMMSRSKMTSIGARTMVVGLQRISIMVPRGRTLGAEGRGGRVSARGPTRPDVSNGRRPAIRVGVAQALTSDQAEKCPPAADLLAVRMAVNAALLDPDAKGACAFHRASPLGARAARQ